MMTIVSGECVLGGDSKSIVTRGRLGADRGRVGGRRRLFASAHPCGRTQAIPGIRT